jgi:glycosyltransferase involved in cell wall biosynthesis
MTGTAVSRPVIAVAVHDGFYGCGTGAGYCNRALLDILPGLVRPGVRLVAIPIRLNPASSEYDHQWHQQTLATLNQAGAEVIPVGNSTGGRTRFGGLTNFCAACSAAAQVIDGLNPPEGRTIVITSDAPFYGLAPLLPPELRHALVSIAHATALLHAPGDSERISWEREGLQETARSGGHIAAISRYMRDHLATAYRIPGAAIVDLPSGLTRGEQHPAAQPAGTLLPPQARGRFLLSFGRAEPYKGFDDLLDALAILKTGHDDIPHTLIGAVTDGPPLTAYQQHLAHRIAAEQHDATLITRFTPDLRALLSHPALAAVIVPSRAEPAGRIPLDAFAAGASPVVATTAGGLAELLTEGETGYTAEPSSPRSLAAAIHRALAATLAQRAQMRSLGRRHLATRYDYQTSVQAFLRAVAPWAIADPQSM